jgi:DNA-binding NarL/FixJ family response regulator
MSSQSDASHLPRPLTATQLREQVLKLLREGYSSREAATTLNIDLTAVERLVGSCTECGS